MDNFIPAPGFDATSLAGSTLILPSVSIGNVPQLTTDLFIHTLQLQRIGFLDEDNVMPVVGVRENGQGVSVAVEVYQSTDRHWTLIQLRSPTFKGKRQAFVNDLCAFITKYKLKQVILLCSADAGYRVDTQITSLPFRVLGALAPEAEKAGIPHLENAEDDKLGELQGSGFAKPLYTQLTASSIPVTLFTMFALEGDNVSDSVAFANVINSMLQLNTTATAWKPPKSWDYLFGTPVNQDLYQ